jgi:hypothetical protein
MALTTLPRSIVFLVDVDDTLLENDRGEKVGKRCQWGEGVRTLCFDEPTVPWYGANMGRPRRAAQGGLVYHVLNRANARLPIFLKDADYEAFFWEHRLLRFEYAYVGLPALDAEPYANGEYLLGVALSVLMRVPPERRADLHAEALKRIARSGENDWRRFLLAECVEAYTGLDEDQRQRLQALLTSEQYQEVRPFMMTTYERGIIEGQRRMALRQLAAKFGPLSPAITQRVQGLSPEQLDQLLLDLLKSSTLKELGLLA